MKNYYFANGKLMREKFLCLQAKKIRSRSLIYDDSNVSNESRAPSYMSQAKVNLFFDVRGSGVEGVFICSVATKKRRDRDLSPFRPFVTFTMKAS